ncbi:MAG: hypothetical protein CYG60_09685, partial [Actinobacteria bacterium]
TTAAGPSLRPPERPRGPRSYPSGGLRARLWAVSRLLRGLYGMDPLQGRGELAGRHTRYPTIRGTDVYEEFL